MTDSYDDHTLVITTFNRPQHLYRLLSFVAQDLPVGRIRVVDGSLEPYRSDNARVVAAFADRMPVELDLLEPGIDVLDHHRHAWACAETPFMTFCHDDNFVVPAAVRDQVAFLRKNPDYANCCGLITCIRTSADRTTAFVCDTDSLEQDDPLDRLAHFLANHWNAEFGTWRSDSRRASGPTFDLYHLDEAIGEPLSIGISALHGKFHMLPILSVIFCLHETNRGTESAERKSNVAMPDFPRILATVGSVIETYCRENGFAPPQDSAMFYLRPYLRFMAKWWHHFEAIAERMRSSTLTDLPDREWIQIVQRAEAAVLDRLLLLSPEECSAIRAEQRRDAAISKPSDGELFIIRDGDVLLIDVPTPDGATKDIMALPPAAGLPAVYQKLCDLMLSDDWHARLDTLRAASCPEILGTSAQHTDARTAFDAAFLQALINLVRPLRGAHPGRCDLFAWMLATGDEISPARDALVSAADHIEIFASPHFAAEGVPSNPTEATPHPERRVFYSRPLSGTVALPFVGGQTQASQGVAFIPLHLSDTVRAMHLSGRQVWLRVEIAEISGRVQFSLYGNEGMDLLVPVTEQTRQREFFFPIRRLDTEFLVMRDITKSETPSQCRIARIGWVASDRPLGMPGAPAGATSAAA